MLNYCLVVLKSITYLEIFIGKKRRNHIQQNFGKKCWSHCCTSMILYFYPSDKYNKYNCNTEPARLEERNLRWVKYKEEDGKEEYSCTGNQIVPDIKVIIRTVIRYGISYMTKYVMATIGIFMMTSLRRKHPETNR